MSENGCSGARFVVFICHPPELRLSFISAENFIFFVVSRNALYHLVLYFYYQLSLSVVYYARKLLVLLTNLAASQKLTESSF